MFARRWLSCVLRSVDELSGARPIPRIRRLRVRTTSKHSGIICDRGGARYTPLKPENRWFLGAHLREFIPADSCLPVGLEFAAAAQTMRKNPKPTYDPLRFEQLLAQLSTGFVSHTDPAVAVVRSGSASHHAIDAEAATLHRGVASGESVSG